MTPLNYELFEFNKMLLVYFFTTIIASAWIVKSVLEGKFSLTRTPLDIPILLFLASQVISAITSIDPHISLFGYYGRFHGGLLSTVSYIILYYAFVSHQSHESYKTYRFLLLSLSSGLLVSLYAVLQRLGIDKNIWVQDVQARPFSTLGQPNWLAAYLAILLPIAIAFALSLNYAETNAEKRRTGLRVFLRKIPRLSAIKTFANRFTLLITLPLIFYTTLLLTRSRSGFLAFWLSNLIFIILIFIILTIRPLLKKTRSQFFLTIVRKKVTFNREILRSLLFINFSFLLITFIIGSPFPQLNRFFSVTSLISPISLTTLTSSSSPPPFLGPALETGGTESGEIRKIVWKGALEAFKARPLFGWGVETFAWVYYKFKPVEHNLTSEWDFLYNKAHNEYLNYAATTGLAGLGGYLFIIITFICWFIKISKSERKINLSALIDLINLNKSQAPNGKQYKLGFGKLGHFLGQLEIRSIRNLVFVGLFSAWLSILITNFFGFSVVPTALYFWLIPAITFSLTTTKETDFSKIVLSSKSSPKIIKIFITVIIFIIFIKFISYLPKLWLSDYHFAKSHSLNRAGDYEQAYQEITKAINLNPGEPLYHDELSIVSTSLAVALYPRDPQNLQIPQLINQAIDASDFALKTSPQNLNFLKTRTRMFYTLSQLEEESQESGINYLLRALKAILTAQKLAPTDAKISYNLALVFEANGQREKAIETLKKTLELKPNYQDAQEALELFLGE